MKPESVRGLIIVVCPFCAGVVFYQVDAVSVGNGGEGTIWQQKNLLPSPGLGREQAACCGSASWCHPNSTTSGSRPSFSPPWCGRVAQSSPTPLGCCLPSLLTVAGLPASGPVLWPGVLGRTHAASLRAAVCFTAGGSWAGDGQSPASPGRPGPAPESAFPPLPGWWRWARCARRRGGGCRSGWSRPSRPWGRRSR